MEQFYGILISVLLGLLVIAIGLLIRVFLLAQKKLVEKTDKDHDEIIRLQCGFKKIHDMAVENKDKISQTRKELHEIEKQKP
ncbi:MAG: hypothetical protein H8E51_08600 [Bacteroidetes bacterium]|nr:hypothetical protein [Bacteroidota bacterium]